MPGLLREMHRQIPDLSIDLISGVGDQLATRLIDGELDVVLTAGLVEGLGNKEFRRDLLGNMDMKVVADPESRLGRKRKISASDLVSVDWVGFYEDEVIVQQSRHFLALRGLPPANFVVRSNSPATLTAFLKGTEFISVLIGPLVSAARNAGLIELQLDEPLWQLPVGLYYRRVAEHSNTLMTFNALCSDAVHVFS
ncbi:MAG: LysR family transcriptional regulator substrate-binding protein [Pseudomonadota bacterium]